MTVAQKWTMAKRPVGEATDDCFELIEEPIPQPEDGEIVVATKYLSLDPYMRGRMRDAKSYAEPLQVGEVITGETAGVVVASKSPKWKEGDALCVHGGWRTHNKVKGDAPNLTPVDESLAPMSTWLGVVGMPGRTAYFGLKEVGKPVSGETLVVSAASGAVGSLVGQLGKIWGLNVVGVAGGPAKTAYCVDELGMDACVDYKGGNLAEDLAKACPNGVDVYFENVGGAVTKAVSTLLKPGARVPICGYISLYNSTEDLETVETPFTIFGGLNPTPEHRFFVVTEFMAQWLEASKEIAGYIADGRVKYKETVVDGFTNAPQAFRGLFHGSNFGKLIVKVS